MCYLVFDVVTSGLRVVFKREWDIRFKKTLGEWLDKPTNGREFHLKETSRNQIKHAHLLATMKNGNTEEWDITMLCYAIIYCDSIGSSLSPAVKSQVGVLRNVRNKTVNSSRASLSGAKFLEIVQKVQFAFESLGLSTQPVQDLKKQTFQFELIQESYDEKKQLEKQVEDLEFEDQQDVSSFCRLPLKPPLEIIGREGDKEKIVQELKKLKKNNEGGLSCLIISGRPGSGKSQLARQVAETFYYDATKITDAHAFVMTLNAESSDSLLESFTSFAQQIKCSEIEVNKVLVSEEETSDEKIIRLKNLIQERIHLYTTWLLVIDNVTGVRSIPLPEAGNALWKTGQMLITTRDTVAELPEDTFTSYISINQGMEPNDAVSLMAAVSGTDDKEMLAKVAKELDYQPLALVNAATCVKHDCQSNEDPNLAWTDILNALRADKEPSVSADVSTPESSIVKYTDVVVRLAVEELIKNDLIKLIFTFLSLFKRKEFDLHTLITYVQKVEELQDKDVQKVKVLQDKDVQKVKELQDKDVQKVKELQDKDVQKVKELQDKEVQKVEELQDKEEIRKTSVARIKACPLLLFEEEANNVKIGVHQVVFNGIKSTLKKRLIPDSPQLFAAVELSYQMEIDPLEESSDMLELVDDVLILHSTFKLLT